MSSIFERLNIRFIFFILSGSFLVFYLFQIPLVTSNEDVLVYVCRSLADRPILNYAFLDQTDGHNSNPIPNYHLAHTVILWLVYKISPPVLSHTIWPAGFISALSGALAIGISFLIWNQLGLSKQTALIIAAYFGIIPSMWHHSIIGEIYALQLLGILAFVYFFLIDQITFSALFFLFANLVSPLSAFSFPLLFLGYKDRKTFYKAFYCGTLAIGCYFFLFYLLDVSILSLFNIVSTSESRSFLWKIYKFSFIILLNINFFLFYLIKKYRLIFEKYKKIILVLLFSIIAQFIYIFANPEFMSQLGSFYLLIFWGISFPVGIIVMEVKNDYFFYFSVVGTVFITLIFWNLEDKQIAVARNNAGWWLRAEIPQNIKVVGDWHNTIHVMFAKYGWDLKKVNDLYIERSYIGEDELNELCEDSVLLVIPKRFGLQAKISKWLFPDLKINKYNLNDDFRNSNLRQLYENDLVAIYRWDKNVAYSQN